MGERALVVDTHAHLVGIDRDRHGCFVSPKMRGKLSSRAVLKTVGTSFDKPPLEVDGRYVDYLHRQLDLAPSLDRAVLFAFDGVYGDDGLLDEARTHLFVPNDYAFEVAATHPKLWVGASVNPYRKNACLELERCARQGAVLCKWIPATQGFDPGDDRCVPFYRKLVELGLPLVSHVGTEFALPLVDKRFGAVERLERALEAGVKLIIPHAGDLKLFREGADWDRLRALLLRYPTALLDESALTLVHRTRRLFRLLEDTGLHARVLHGSDFPLPVHAWAFATRLGVARARALSSIPSTFERDVQVKRALGAPDAFFTQAVKFLRLPAENRSP